MLGSQERRAHLLGVATFTPRRSPEVEFDELSTEVSTCSRDAARVEGTDLGTDALRRAIAARPATPAPTMKTLAGGVLPAAVIWPGMNRPKCSAASMTADIPRCCPSH